MTRSCPDGRAVGESACRQTDVAASGAALGRKTKAVAMSITGRVNLVTNPTGFFAPIVLGAGAPTPGFIPSTKSGFVIRMTGRLLGLFPVSVSANVSTENGNFILPDFLRSSP
jgi:hypothetical protein